MTTVDELLAEIFEGKKSALYVEFAGWLRNSRRFKAFAVRYRTKIRAKLKNARDERGVRDLHAELETAAVLLRDERFTLEYEKYAASKQRGPDFTVTYRTNTPFNVEVRRLHRVELRDGDTEALIGKLMTVLCEKVGQMPPSIVNALWLVAEGDISQDDLVRAVTTLRQLAERKTDEYFTRRGFASAAEFLKYYIRLSAIVLHPAAENSVWLNALARHKPPREIVTALERLNASEAN